MCMTPSTNLLVSSATPKGRCAFFLLSWSWTVATISHMHIWRYKHTYIVHRPPLLVWPADGQRNSLQKFIYLTPFILLQKLCWSSSLRGAWGAPVSTRRPPSQSQHQPSFSSDLSPAQLSANDARPRVPMEQLRKQLRRHLVVVHAAHERPAAR